MGGPSSIDFIYFSGSNENQRSCDGQGGVGAQRPVLRGNQPKKTGARSARARTHGQNPLVINNTMTITFLQFLTVPTCYLSYSMSSSERNNQITKFKFCYLI